MNIPRSLYLAAALLLVPVFSAAHATDAGSCYVIADADARAYCLALAHKNAGRCYVIQDGGLRSRCLAEIRK